MIQLLTDFFSPIPPAFWSAATEVPFFEFVLFLVLILGITSAFLFFDLKKSERKLSHLQRQIQKKSLLINSLTHDLSNSLLVMDMASQQLSRDEVQPKPMLRLQQSLAHQRFLLNATKTLQLYYRKTLKPTLVSVPIFESLKKSLSLFEALIKHRNLKVEFESIESPLVTGENSLMTNGLFQSLLHLIFKNAPDESLLVVKTSSEANEVKVTLKSSHCCITPEQLKQWQVEDDIYEGRVEIEPGKTNLDIGFMQAQAVMKAFGGRLEVNTNEETGTEFIVVFQSIA